MRQTLRSPGWLLAAASILALGIGAPVALYSVVRAVLLRPPMFAAPEELGVIWERDRKRGQEEVEVSWGRFQEMRKASSTLAGLASVSSVNLDFALLDGGDPVQVEGVQVTANYFDVLGVRPVLGRALARRDEAEGDVTAVVISHRLWVERFGAQASVVEQKLKVSGTPCRVVGVMPEGFAFPRGVDIWTPQNSLEKFRDLRVLQLVGRRRAEASWGQVEADLNVILRRLDEQLPETKRGFLAHVVPMDQVLLGNARTGLWTLLAASFLLLGTACANVVNLFLARVAARSRELTIRSALGAGRGDLVRLLVGEAAVVAGLASGLGVLFAMWVVGLAAKLGPEDVPGLAEAAVSWDAAMVAIGLALATALVVGLAPFVRVGAGRLRDALVVAEVAISLALLIGCGLIGSSLWNLSRVDPGFAKEGVLTFRVTLAGEAAGSQEGRKKFYRELLEKLRAMPGVSGAGAVLIRPLGGSVGWDSPFTVEGQTPEEVAGNPYANYEAVSPGYFSVMGIPVLAGREFTDVDRTGVVMISANAAARYFGGQGAVGRRIQLGGSKEWLTVVGVVKDAHYREWEAARVDLYVPVEQRAQHRSDFVVRTTVPPETLVEPVRRAVLTLHAEQPISNVTTMAKSNLHELASGITTAGSAFGQTRNPYDPSRNPGGSSGGTGAAIAASFAAAGMGSDTCGSIRIPASVNNLTGLRPTKGLSSIAGIVPLSVTQDTGGPLARTVADLAAVLDATIGEDPNDPATRNAPKLNFTAALQPGALKGAKIGILEPLFGDTNDDAEVLKIVRDAIDELKKQGATTVPVPMKDLLEALKDSSVITHEFKEDLAQYLATHGAPPVHSLEEIVKGGLVHTALVPTFTRHLASKGRTSHEYKIAQAKRTAVQEMILKLMEDEKLDALVYPTMRRKPARVNEPQGGSSCQLSASTGFPAITVPAGFTADGLPVGLELLGRAFEDTKLLAYAYAYEQATRHRRAPARTPSLKKLSPQSWQNSVQSTGTLTANFILNPATGELGYSLTAANFQPGEILAATLHRTAKEENGPVIAVLANRDFQQLTGVETLSDPDREKLKSGGLYLRLTTKSTNLRLTIKP